MNGLAGRSVAVTRAPHQAREMELALAERGALALPYPCIDIAPPKDSAPLDRALRRAVDGAFDWLILTSANTVEALRRRLVAIDLSESILAGADIQVAAVGPATAEAARRSLHLEVSLVPDAYHAQALIPALHLEAGQRVLLPQSEIAEAGLLDGLRAAGADVIRVDAYCTVLGQGGVDLPQLLTMGKVAAVTFTSASTVRNFVRRLERDRGRLDALAGVPIAVIGPKTADAARALGLAVDVQPVEHTVSELVVALEAHFRRTHSGSDAM